MWEIRRYDKGLKEEWNAFVKKARNSTFLFDRGYMDYHADRFEDHSLLAYRNGKLSAVLPANIVKESSIQNDSDYEDKTLYSHQGLTYGGWVWDSKGLDTVDIYDLWKLWLKYCKRQGIGKIIYKRLPYIYSRQPSDEDQYMLFLSEAKSLQTNIASAIDLHQNPGYNKLQKRHLKQNEESYVGKQIDAQDKEAVKEFHAMLTACLEERHDARPVHTLEELQKLIESFPENIRIWTAFLRGEKELMAGVCAYITETTAHCQYIATSSRGRELNILASLFKEMIEYYTAVGLRYFDFGTSNEGNGWLLNSGLNRQKTSYGGSGVAYQAFEISIVSALESLPNELWPPK